MNIRQIVKKYLNEDYTGGPGYFEGQEGQYVIDAAWKMGFGYMHPGAEKTPELVTMTRSDSYVAGKWATLKIRPDGSWKISGSGTYGGASGKGEQEFLNWCNTHHIFPSTGSLNQDIYGYLDREADASQPFLPFEGKQMKGKMLKERVNIREQKKPLPSARQPGNEDIPNVYSGEEAKEILRKRGLSWNNIMGSDSGSLYFELDGKGVACWFIIDKILTIYKDR